MKRNEIGILVLDSFNKVIKKEVGRKQKNWLENNGKEYLFKTGASNYEIFAEVISAELAHQCNLSTADYDIAIYNGHIGVVTPSFLKPGDIILSGEDLFKYAKLFSPESKFYNSIDSIVDMLKLCTSRDYDIENIKKELTKIWLFDGLICESDRNFSNWSIIINGNNIKVAPIYDCSTMCRMNNDINSLIRNVRDENDIISMVSSIKFQLKRKQEDRDDDFLDAFHSFCKEEPVIAKQFIDSLDMIDVNKAIENIEKRMNEKNDNLFQIPWEINFWINKIIKIRIEILRSIYKYSLEKIETIEKNR